MVADMSNGKNKEEIRKKFRELDKDFKQMKEETTKASYQAPLDIQQITLKAKKDLRKFRKKL